MDEMNQAQKSYRYESQQNKRKYAEKFVKTSDREEKSLFKIFKKNSLFGCFSEIQSEM